MESRRGSPTPHIMPSFCSQCTALNITLRPIGDTKDDFPERNITLTPNEPIYIGRSSKTDRRRGPATGSNAYIDSPVVSRDHAVISTPDSKTVMIVDVGSMHGTKVNDINLTKRVIHSLNNGDVLEFGTTVTRNSDTFAPPKYSIECQLPQAPPSSTSPFEAQIIKIVSRTYSVPESDSESDSDSDNDVSEIDSIVAIVDEESQSPIELNRFHKESELSVTAGPADYPGSQSNPLTISDETEVAKDGVADYKDCDLNSNLLTQSISQERNHTWSQNAEDVKSNIGDIGGQVEDAEDCYDSNVSGDQSSILSYDSDKPLDDISAESDSDVDSDGEESPHSQRKSPSPFRVPSQVTPMELPDFDKVAENESGPEVEDAAKARRVEISKIVTPQYEKSCPRVETPSQVYRPPRQLEAHGAFVTARENHEAFPSTITQSEIPHSLEAVLEPIHQPERDMAESRLDSYQIKSQHAPPFFPYISCFESEGTGNSGYPEEFSLRPLHDLQDEATIENNIPPFRFDGSSPTLGYSQPRLEPPSPYSVADSNKPYYSFSKSIDTLHASLPHNSVSTYPRYFTGSCISKLPFSHTPVDLKKSTAPFSCLSKKVEDTAYGQGAITTDTAMSQPCVVPSNTFMKPKTGISIPEIVEAVASDASHVIPASSCPIAGSKRKASEISGDVSEDASEDSQPNDTEVNMTTAIKPTSKEFVSSMEPSQVNRQPVTATHPPTAIKSRRSTKRVRYQLAASAVAGAVVGSIGTLAALVFSPESFFQ